MAWLTPPTYTNGHHTPTETPPAVGGVSSPPAPRTTFAADPALRGLDAIFYGLARFHVLGMPAGRSLSALWLAVAFLAWVGLIPGGRVVVTLAALLLTGQIIYWAGARRRSFVRFTPASAPPTNALRLTIADKLPIFATGILNVEGKYRPYTWLPGYYRTFATGEHAILCLVQPRRWLGIMSWQPEELGMWYAFVQPTEVTRVEAGTLRFGSHAAAAVAIHYTLTIPPGPRRKRPTVQPATLYLSGAPDDIARAYADLQPAATTATQAT